MSPPAAPIPYPWHTPTASFKGHCWPFMILSPQLQQVLANVIFCIFIDAIMQYQVLSAQ